MNIKKSVKETHSSEAQESHNGSFLKKTTTTTRFESYTEIDLENNYYKEYYKHYIFDGSVLLDIEEYTYYVIKDNKGYKLVNDLVKKTKSKEEISTDKVKEKIKSELLTSNYYIYGYDGDFLANFSKKIEELEKKKEEYRSKSKTYEYSFLSSGDYNLLLKINSYGNTMEKGIITDFKDNSEEKYENSLVKSHSREFDYEYAGGDQIYDKYKGTSDYQYNVKIKQDSINLDEYK